MNRKIKNTFMSLMAMFAFVGSANAQHAVEGYWKSIDDETSTPTAYWKLEVRDDQLIGVLVTYPDQKPDDVCDACTGKAKKFRDQPRIGAEFLKLEEEKDGTWEDGYIVDPNKGELYKAKVWEENGDLMVRGYIGFLYKTQVWKKASQEEAEAGVF